MLKYCIVRNFVSCTPHHLLLGDQIKEGGKGKECGSNGGEEKCIQNLDSKT
jgi:hypothetical protein